METLEEVKLTSLNGQATYAEGAWSEQGITCYFDCDIRPLVYVVVFNRREFTELRRTVAVQIPIQFSDRGDDWESSGLKARICNEAWQIVLRRGGFSVIAEICEPFQQCFTIY